MKRNALRLLTVCLLLMFMGTAHASRMDVLFFNAGKADATLIRTENSTVLIDTGKNKFGKEIVHHLLENGIEYIDVLFITHFDKDHVGGADTVMENIEIGMIVEPSYHSDAKQYEQYREMIEAYSIPVETLKRNAVLELDGIRYTIDVANRTDYGKDEENDFSLVISMQHGENTFLFAGDAENPRLGELIAEGVGRHDVLKVPHHGRAEKLSAAFFDAVQPAFSIITSDAEEPEDEQVVRMLRKYGEVFLTREGAAACISDGQTIQITQEKGGQQYD